MAKNPCKYLFEISKGEFKEFTEAELKDYLVEQDLSKLKPIQDAIQERGAEEILQREQAGARKARGGREGVEPSKQREKTSIEGEVDEKTEKIRSVYRQLINRSTELTEDQKSILENDPNAIYTVMPPAQAREFALDLIKQVGVENAVLEATKSNLEPVERVMILGAAMDYYAKLGRQQFAEGKSTTESVNDEIDANEKLKEVTAELGKLGTAYGRAINIHKEIYKLSGLALIKKLQNTVEELNEVRAKDATDQAKVIIKIIKEEAQSIDQAAKELTESDLEGESSVNKNISQLEKEIINLKKQIAERDNAAKGTKKNPLSIKRITNDTEYDRRLKDFNQRARSIASKDDLVDLTYFGLYHIENGLTNFADWYKVMSSKFKGFKKELKGIYNGVKDKAVQNGADEKLFDSEEKVQSYLDGLQDESDAKKMLQATKKSAIAKLKKEEDNNPEKARKIAPRMAAERIRKDAESNLGMASTKEEQTYLKKLVKVVSNKAKEYYASKKENVSNVNDMLSFAIANGKKDFAIWENTKEELDVLIDEDENLTDDQKEDIKDFLADYTDSIFETLLTKNQISNAIREKLISAGYFTEKVIDNKSVKSVDWSKVIGKASNILDAKEKITKSILDLGFTLEQAKPEINAILDQFDSKVADIKTKEINRFLNKGALNKIKTALGKKTPVTKVSRLIEMNNKGLLTNDKVKDALAKELGLVTLTNQDIEAMQNLSDKIDDPNIPFFMKKQAEEQMQYIMDLKGGNIDYLENREAMMANRLSSVYNQIQNSTGFFRTISTLITVATKTGKPFEAAKVFGKEFMNSLNDAKSILLRGRVSRGSSFADLTRVSEGEARVRYLEQGIGKFMGGKAIGKPMYVEIKGKKMDLNPLNAAYSKVKYIQRLLEAVDTPSSNIVSGLTQFWQINREINKFYPELSAKDKSQKVYDIMYSLNRDAEAIKAISDLKSAGVSDPKSYEINRTINERVERARNEELSKEFYKTLDSLKTIAETKLKADGVSDYTNEDILNEAYKMIGGTSPLDVVARGERQAGRETGKTTTTGLTSLLLLPVDLIQKGISGWVKKSKTKTGVALANTSDMVFSQLFPFAHSIGRWIEMQIELTPYGAIKGIAYKGYAKFAEDGKTEISNDEYNELGDDYIIRSVIGAGYTTAGMFVIGMAKSLAGDDDEAEDAIVGTSEAEKFTQERVKSVGKPKQTVKIGGYNIPLQLAGNTGIVLGMYADYVSMNKTPENSEKGLLYISSIVAMNSVIDATWFSNASKYGNLASSVFKGKEEKFAPGLGRIAGGILGSQIPFNRAQVEFATLMNPQSQQSVDFGTNVLNQMSILKSFQTGKPSFDYRGRTYDYGDIYANSADGVKKMFSKAKYGDEIDTFLSKINFAATDAYRESREVDNYKFSILNQDGTKRYMTNDEYYEFKRITGVTFNDYLKEDYKDIKTEVIEDDQMATSNLQKDIISQILSDSKAEAFVKIQEATGFDDPQYLKQLAKEKAKDQKAISKIKKYYKK
jgi:hypothetical protein